MATDTAPSIILFRCSKRPTYEKIPVSEDGGGGWEGIVVQLGGIPECLGGRSCCTYRLRFSSIETLSSHPTIGITILPESTAPRMHNHSIE